MATMKIGIRNEKRYGRYKMYEVNALGFEDDIRILKRFSKDIVELAAKHRQLIALVAGVHKVPQKVVRRLSLSAKEAAAGGQQ